MFLDRRRRTARRSALRRHWDEVLDAAARHGTSPNKQDWRAVTYLHLADTREEAIEQARHGAIRDVHNYFYTINTARSWLIDKDQRPEDLTFEQIVDSRRWIIGTPDDAIEQIEAIAEETGGIGGLMMTTHEWMPMRHIMYSQELFARYVMPRFRGHTADLEREWERTKSDRATGRIPNIYARDDGGTDDGSKSNVFVKV